MANLLLSGISASEKLILQSVNISIDEATTTKNLLACFVGPVCICHSFSNLLRYSII